MGFGNVCWGWIISGDTALVGEMKFTAKHHYIEHGGSLP